MSRRFRPEPEASAELEHAALWYEDERPGLGVNFLDAIDATLVRIAEWPDAAPRVRNLPADVPARHAPVSGFPYHIAYLVTHRHPDSGLRARQPRTWLLVFSS